MSWVQIKRALNRSLGTKEFKPLDELIKGQKTLIASDNLYSYIGTPGASWSASQANTTQLPMTLKMNTSGSARIYFEGSSLNSTYLGYLYIYKNGVREYSYLISVAPAVNEFYPLTYDTSFTKGDVYSFELVSTISVCTVNIANFQLKADVVDGSLIEITESEE